MAFVYRAASTKNCIVNDEVQQKSFFRRDGIKGDGSGEKQDHYGLSVFSTLEAASKLNCLHVIELDKEKMEGFNYTLVERGEGHFVIPEPPFNTEENHDLALHHADRLICCVSRVIPIPKKAKI